MEIIDLRRVLKKKHNAIAQNFDPIAPDIGTTYTIHLQEAFAQFNKHPIVFISPLIDIKYDESNNSKFIATFGHIGIDREIRISLNKPVIDYKLSCPKDNFHNKVFDVNLNYAIVATISSINRVDYTTKVDFFGDSASFQIIPSRIFVAQGTCLEVVEVPQKPKNNSKFESQSQLVRSRPVGDLFDSIWESIKNFARIKSEV